MDDFNEALSQIAEHLLAIKAIMDKHECMMCAEVWKADKLPKVALYGDSGFTFTDCHDSGNYRTHYSVVNGVSVEYTTTIKEENNG